MPRTKLFNREHALDRALQVFWTQGYEAASLDALLEAMGVGRQSLYDTFEDKRQLYLAALERYSDGHLAELQGILMRSGSVKKALKDILEGPARQPRAARLKGCFLVNSAVELAPHDPDVSRAVAAGFKAEEEAFTAAIQRGRSTGELERRGEARDLASLVVTLMHGMRVAGKANAAPETLLAMARAASAFAR